MTPEEHAVIVGSGLHECASDCPPMTDDSEEAVRLLSLLDAIEQRFTDRPAASLQHPTAATEPRTEAGKALHKHQMFDLTVEEDRRRLALAIEAEAAQGAAPRATLNDRVRTDIIVPVAAPRAEGLDEAWAEARRVERHITPDTLRAHWPRAEGLPSDGLLAEAMHSTRAAGHRSHALEECDTMNVAYMEAWAGRVRDWLASLSGAAPRAEGLDVERLALDDTYRQRQWQLRKEEEDRL